MRVCSCRRAAQKGAKTRSSGQVQYGFSSPPLVSVAASAPSSFSSPMPKVRFRTKLSTKSPSCQVRYAPLFLPPLDSHPLRSCQVSRPFICVGGEDQSSTVKFESVKSGPFRRRWCRYDGVPFASVCKYRKRSSPTWAMSRKCFKQCRDRSLSPDGLSSQFDTRLPR
jgi:hypothetical protein